MQNHVVIMAGGVGSRFWPMSTPEYPKQFVDVLGTGKTMIQMTVERFAPLCPMSNFWVVTSEPYVAMVREQLPEIPVENIIAEPCARNTAPCIAYACWKIRMSDPYANIVVTPADAMVQDVNEFRKVIGHALDFTAAGCRIVTVGITPTRPETGYGYIKEGEHVVDGIHKVQSFREKPSLEVAQSYLDEGGYLWNAGIFVWKAQTITDAIRTHAPSLAALMDQMAQSFYSEEEHDAVARLFPTCEKISIDYAVMEKADNIYTIPADFGWSDLGTWGSLWTLKEKTEEGNAIVGEDVRMIDSKDCIVHAPGSKSVVLQGLEDSIVVERDGRLLICKLSEEQRIKDFKK